MCAAIVRVVSTLVIVDAGIDAAATYVHSPAGVAVAREKRLKIGANELGVSSALIRGGTFISIDAVVICSVSFIPSIANTSIASGIIAARTAYSTALVGTVTALIDVST